MLQKKLRALKSLWEFLIYGFTNNPGSCKSDLCQGLGNVDITKHTKARGDATGGRVGQN